jgi:cytidine deaminase
MTNAELIATATALVGEFRTSQDCVAGGVASALLTRSGKVYTGICVDTACSLGFCAEHAAIAEMLKARESEIERIVAVNAAGAVVPPCGRYRELIRQVSAKNADTHVIVAIGKTVLLADLLPLPWSEPS